METAGKTTMDAAGRLVIPKAVRRAAGLEPGTALLTRWRGGHIEIEPVPTPVRLIQEGLFLVAEADVETGPLTADDVEQARQTLAAERG